MAGDCHTDEVEGAAGTGYLLFVEEFRDCIEIRSSVRVYH